MAAPPGNPAVAEASASKLSKPAITFATADGCSMPAGRNARNQREAGGSGQAT